MAAQLELRDQTANQEVGLPLVANSRIPLGLPSVLAFAMDVSPGLYPNLLPEESLNGLTPLPSAIALVREIKYPHPKERVIGRREETRENRIRSLVTTFHEELSFAIQERNTDVEACHGMLRTNIQFLVQTALVDQDIHDEPIRQQLLNLAIGIADDTSPHMQAYIKACGGNFRGNNRFAIQADVTESILVCSDWLRMNGRTEEASRIIPRLVYNFEFDPQLLEKDQELTPEEIEGIAASVDKNRYTRQTEFGPNFNRNRWQREVDKKIKAQRTLKYKAWLSGQPLISGVTPFVAEFTDTVLAALRTHALHTGIETILQATDKRLQHTPSALLREMLFALEGGAKMRIEHPETWVGLLYELATVINPNISLMIAELAGDGEVTKQLAKTLARVGILDEGALRTYDVVFRDYAALYRGPQEFRVRPQTTFVHGHLASFCPVLAKSIRSRYRVGPGRHDRRFLTTHSKELSSGGSEGQTAGETIEQGRYEPLMHRSGDSGPQAALYFLKALMDNLEADWMGGDSHAKPEVRVFEMLNILLLRTGMKEAEKGKYKGSILEAVDTRIADFIITELMRVIQAEQVVADSLVLNLLRNVGYFLPTSLKEILLDRAIIQADKTVLFADSPKLWRELVNAVGYPHAYLEVTEPDKDITAKVLKANVQFLSQWRTDPACMTRSDRWLALQIKTALMDAQSQRPNMVVEAVDIASLYGSTAGLQDVTTVLLDDIRRFHLWSIRRLPRLVPPEPVIAVADVMMDKQIFVDAERRIKELKEQMPEAAPQLLPDTYPELLAESVTPYQGVSIVLQHFAHDLEDFSTSTGEPSEVLEKLIREAELGMPEQVRDGTEFQQAQANFRKSSRGNYWEYLMTLRMMESLGTARASALQPLEGLLRQLQAMGEFDYTHEVQRQAITVISASVKVALDVIKDQETGSRTIIGKFIQEHQSELTHLLTERKDALEVIHGLEAAILTRQQGQVKAQVERQLKHQQAQLDWLGEVEKVNQEVAGIVRSLGEIVGAANYRPPAVVYGHLTAEEIQVLMNGGRLPEESRPVTETAPSEATS